MPTTSARIAAAANGRYRVKVSMALGFHDECHQAATRAGVSLDSWIVAAMLHMLERPARDAQHLEVVEGLRAENEKLARRLADSRKLTDAQGITLPARGN